MAANAADAISDIVGPVTPYGTSPWPYYDKAAKGNADEIMPAALRYLPKPGPAAAGTFTLADKCNVTLTGAGASEFHAGDWAIVAWNPVEGPPGSGSMLFIAAAVAGDVMTSANQCGLNGLIRPAAGLTVYHCGAQCKDGVTEGGLERYNCTLWGMCNLNGNPWGFYDPGLALYRMYLRTGDAKYRTLFRDYADTWWAWALDHGGKVLNPPRASSLVSQFVRALDGHAERLPALYRELKVSFDARILTEVDGNDNREPGYALLYAAVGARADDDPARRAWYCAAVTSHTKQWLATQTPEGYWSEKNGPFPAKLPGVSPWRMFATMQGLARSYDVLKDPAVCNNPALAADTLKSVGRAATFAYTYGYAANASRGVYYDVEYPDAELEQTPGAGAVSVAMGSTAVTGTGTTFLKTFAPCDGTKFIGISHQDGMAWTHAVTGCADDTHLTLGTPWGSECIVAPGGKTCAKTNAANETYVVVPAAPSNCASKASHCWSGQPATGKTVTGDRNNNRDLIWIMGWMYKTTGEENYKTWGDELFSASYGGPVNGPGDNSGRCGGKGCDGFLTDYGEAIHGCSQDPHLPCNPRTGYPGGNVWVFGTKRWAQGSGIGGADNYLAWRGPELSKTVETFPIIGAPPPSAPPAGGSTGTSSVSLPAAPAPLTGDIAGAALVRSADDPDSAIAMFTAINFPKEKQPNDVRRDYVEVRLQRLLMRAHSGRCRDAMGAIETLGDEDTSLPFTLYGFGPFMRAPHFQYYLGVIESLCGDDKAAKRRWSRMGKPGSAFESAEDVFQWLALKGLGEKGWEEKLASAVQAAHAEAGSGAKPELRFIEGTLLSAAGKRDEGSALLEKAVKSPDTMVQYLSLVGIRENAAKPPPLLR